MGKAIPETLILKTAKLLPYIKRSKTLPGYATAYDFEPEPSQAGVLGNLLVAIEVLAVPKQAEAVADLIIQTLGQTFYKLPRHTNTSQPAPLSAYDRFETAVKAVNSELNSYAEKGKASWVGRLSAILAVQAGQELHITQAGSAQGYLYRHGQVTHITNEMSSTGPHRPQTSFSSIASGELESNDRLVLATPALFHQVDRQRLNQIITDNRPETSVSKLSDLINQSHHADRVAALIIEVTTPELLAMQRGVTQTETEIKVGQPDNLLTSAKEAAAPVVIEGLGVAKRAGTAAIDHSRRTIMPRLKQLALVLVQALKALLREPRQRRWLWALMGLIFMLIGFLIYQSTNSRSINKLTNRYIADYAIIHSARSQITNGDKTAARQNLVLAKADLDQLSRLPQAGLINRRLTHQRHAEDDPSSINALKNQASQLIDQIDGLVTVSYQEITGLEALKGSKPSRLESVAAKLVLIDSVNGQLTIFDPTNKQFGSPVTAPNLGKIISSTASSNDDGVYLITDEPSVWFFKLDGSLVKQSTSFGSWPQSRAIASYAGNLYLLANDSSQIYKHTPNLGGFSGKTNYLVSDSSGISGATSITVDGSVYTGGPFGLKRFLAGKLNSSAPLPDTLTHSASLISAANGDTILVIDPVSGRLGLMSGKTNLSFSQQITLTNQTKLVDAKLNSNGKTVYGLTNSKLIKFSLPR